MPQLMDTEFTAYAFTEDEDIIAHHYSELQLMALKTQLSVVASEKLSLDPEQFSLEGFQLRHEYLRGKMDFAKGMIELSEAIKQRLEDNIVRQQRQRPQFGDQE